MAAEMFPVSRIATAIGFAAFFGNLGGAATAQLAGWLLQHYGTVTPIFFLCAGGYATAWLVLHLARIPKAQV